MTKTLKKNKFSKFLFVSKKNAMTAAAIRAPATVSNNFSESTFSEEQKLCISTEARGKSRLLVKNLLM